MAERRRPRPEPYVPPRVLAVENEWNMPGRMRELAETEEKRGPELRRLADRLERAYRGFFREPQLTPTNEFVAAFRAAVASWVLLTAEDPGPEIGQVDVERLRVAALLQAAPRLVGTRVQ